MNIYDKIILISIDTLRSDCLASNPYKLYPHTYTTTQALQRSKLDNVIAEGVFFPNTISVAPYTPASHAAYFTGKWQKNNGVYDQFNSTLKSETLFHAAKKMGYETVFKTDFPLVLGKYLNFLGGVDKYYIEDEDAALEQLKSNDKTLAFLHFGQIHYPYGFHSLKYGGEDYRKKVEQLEQKYKISHDTINLEDMAIESFRDQTDLELLYRYKAVISYLYTHRLDDDLFDLYLEGVNYFHEHLFNTFIDTLEKSLIGQNYLIVIFGDHGEAWSDDTYGHHNSSDEGVLRVPLIFKGVNIPKGIVHADRIRTIDLYPTILKCMGIKEAVCDGETLEDYLKEGPVTKTGNRTAFSAVWVNELKDILRKTDSILDGNDMDTDERIAVRYSAAIYKDDYKYVHTYKRFANRTEALEPFDQEFLFDISDLGNTKRVDIDEHEDLVAAMRRELTILNDIEPTESEISNRMREYFKMQGYNV